MVTPVYRQKHQEVLDSMLLEIPGVKAGKAFGYPGYYVGGKLFACVYEDGVSLKVPEEVRERLLQEKGVDFFVPMGRVKMKEWVLITKKRSADYLKYENDFIEAIQYVLALSTKPPAKKTPAKKTPAKK